MKPDASLRATTMPHQGVLPQCPSAGSQISAHAQKPVANGGFRLNRFYFFGLPLKSATISFALFMLILVAAPRLLHILADSKPNVQLNVDNARPRSLEDSTQTAILRDYTAAWQAIHTAFANNTTSPLNEDFTGLALDKLTQRVKDQRADGLHTRIMDHGHHLDAIFYSRDGSAIELRDTASIETQILDGNTVLHSDNAQVQYVAVMTGAADRWQVRVLESVAK